MLLALRALGLGDLLAAVPALRGLRSAFPEHRRLLATPSWLHPLCELIGGWEPVPMPDLAAKPPPLAGHLDVAVNLHGNGPRSASVLDSLLPRHRIGHRRPGWPGPDWIRQLPERHRWCRLLTAHGIVADELDLRLHHPRRPAAAEGAILVHPGSARAAKRWPLSRFAEVAAAYSAAGHRVVITGSAAERELADRVADLAGPGPEVLAGRTDLRRLAAQVFASRLVISGDTGIAHLAYAYRTPTVTLFGPVEPWLSGPPPVGPHRTLGGTHPRGDLLADQPDPSLLEITVDDVLASGSELGVPPSAVPDDEYAEPAPASALVGSEPVARSS